MPESPCARHALTTRQSRRWRRARDGVAGARRRRGMHAGSTPWIRCPHSHRARRQRQTKPVRCCRPGVVPLTQSPRRTKPHPRAPDQARRAAPTRPDRSRHPVAAHRAAMVRGTEFHRHRGARRGLEGPWIEVCPPDADRPRVPGVPAPARPCLADLQQGSAWQGARGPAWSKAPAEDPPQERPDRFPSTRWLRAPIERHPRTVLR